MIADVRYADEVADHRNNGKEQRDEKNDLRWCIQSRHVGPLLRIRIETITRQASRKKDTTTPQRQRQRRLTHGNGSPR